MMCHTKLAGLQFHLTESSQHQLPGWLRQAKVQDSVSMNYGKSRMSWMLLELILQFSVLCFCKSRGKNRPPPKEEKWLYSRLANYSAADQHCLGFWGCYVL
jgi:hypothetical protein